MEADKADRGYSKKVEDIVNDWATHFWMRCTGLDICIF